MPIDYTGKPIILTNVKITHRLFKQLVHDAHEVAIDYSKQLEIDVKKFTNLDTIGYTKYINESLITKATQRMNTWSILLEASDLITWNTHKDLIAHGDYRVFWELSNYISHFDKQQFNQLLSQLDNKTVDNYIRYKMDLPQALEWYFDECRSIEDNLIHLAEHQRS